MAESTTSDVQRLTSDVRRQTSILDTIVEAKKREIDVLYQQHDLETLKATLGQGTLPDIPFYRALAEAAADKRPFIIAEFKRKSPSEGWINQDADISTQVRAYQSAGAGAVSVLTDQAFFGGSYEDLQLAAKALDPAGILLQKDFILDPIQIYLAKRAGAGIILLIAAILDPGQLESLRALAESLGIGVIVEVHDQSEFDLICHLDFPVLGVNNRDLKTFRTSMNRFNVLARQAGSRYLIAESGIGSYRDVRMVDRADGFLIGTTLMKSQTGIRELVDSATRPRLLFKACGIRSATVMSQPGGADYFGLNFSPVSKRRIAADTLTPSLIAAHPEAVAVFYRNSEAEIREILARFPFRIVQLYAEEHTPEFIRSLSQKVFLACAVRQTSDLDQLEAFAPDIDLFILDGAQPGSGQRIETAIPADFPYPFLLAGGLHAGNLNNAMAFQNCVGVDIASGIETDGTVDLQKIEVIAQLLVNQQNAAPIT
jgi:indole-3-glycerol phosphate synthase/phosphoribosylanthranilate isomerase/anthranilate synthase/indole-3-glycerol phosphate synthase/phosphoribosylanthranilate isomerase